MKKTYQMEEGYKNSIHNYENMINAWRNVKRITKKDGTDFLIMSKNFENAILKKDYSWMDYYTLTVDYKYANGGYTYDNITVDNNDTVDDIFRKINERIKGYETSKRKIEEKLSKIKDVFGEIDNIMKQLIPFCKQNGFSAYEVCNYIRENYYQWEED